jgi:transposase
LRLSSWRAIRGVSIAQAARDLDVHENVLRKWVKDFEADSAQSFPGNGRMKPEQLKIERVRREVIRLKAERDILKRMACPVCKRLLDSNCSASTYPVSGAVSWPRWIGAINRLCEFSDIVK